MLNIFLNLGIFAKVIILILLGFSVISWAIIFAKYRLLKKLRRECDKQKNRLFYFSSLEELKESLSFKNPSIFTRLQRVAVDAESSVNLKSVNFTAHLLNETIDNEMKQCEKYIPFLATVGSVSPFLGLLGTVWGITKVFFDVKELPLITLQAIAPGMADALITTIAGLLVAIPAVIAYNYFVARTEEIRHELDKFANYLLTIANKK